MSKTDMSKADNKKPLDDSAPIQLSGARADVYRALVANRDAAIKESDRWQAAIDEYLKIVGE